MKADQKLTQFIESLHSTLNWLGGGGGEVQIFQNFRNHLKLLRTWRKFRSEDP
jgi:hypothetical protein